MPVALFALVASIGLGFYVQGHIRINTDINQLLSDNLGWRQREKALERAFPDKSDNLVVVIDSDSADKADAAAASLAAKLDTMKDLFPFVSRPDALPFFRTNGLLFLSKKELGATLDQIAQSQPLIAMMVTDPSLRGFFGTIGLMMQGIQAGAMDPKQIEAPLTAINQTIKAALAGQDAPLDWQKMTPDAMAANPHLLRKFIVTKPVLDYSALQPGEKATQAVRQAALDLGITPANGVRMRLTGSVPLNDEEFASVSEGTGTATILSGVLVLVLLFFAMRSWRIVLPIMLTLCVGLVASTAFATFAVGSLNLISVAFAVMFIGIAVDFGIQFGVRYRDQRHSTPDHATALRQTATLIAVPLAMAAGSTALGFLSFIPTDYRGVSELGLIAGSSMVIAFILNITLLPALMTLTNPPAEAEMVGYASLAPLNAFLASKRKILTPIIFAVALIGLVIASQVRFDFDPLDLKNPKSESVATMFDVMRDPDSDAYAAQILAPSLEEAQKRAAEFDKLPETDHTMTVASFVPEDQDTKLKMIADTFGLLASSYTLPHQPTATDEDNMNAIRNAASTLHQAGDKMPAAQALANTLDSLVKNYTPDMLKRAQDNIILPLQAKMASLKNIAPEKPVTLDDIPAELKKDWVTQDGQYLVEIFPKRAAPDNPRDPQTLENFVSAVEKIAPDVSGSPVSIRESAHTIISAFVHAGIYGITSIALLSLLVLRRPRDVILMITPLVIAGILTLATITLIGLPLNFANIIALPLLLSLGVSYAVYFVFFARQNRRDFLQSSMARAVLFSAATVFVAFASLTFSSHPGTRGMGELLTIALLYSLTCTFILLPILLSAARPDRNKPI